jgi:tryptophan synthase alpha chain
MTVVDLAVHLRDIHQSGRKILVPYITGFVSHWQDAVQAVTAAGADAIEIGIPFSDPVMDGPVIQRASSEALRNGASLLSILREVRRLDVGIPLVAMCYYNTVFRAGHRRCADEMAQAGFSGVIVPDLPLEESGEWCEAADAAGLSTVMLAAPTAPDDRLPLIAGRSRGFVYAVGLLGVTGERRSLSSSAVQIAARVKAITTLPVLVGVGVSDAEQAKQVCEIADGVIQGAAVMRRLLDEGVDSVSAFVREVRLALGE